MNGSGDKTRSRGKVGTSVVALFASSSHRVGFARARLAVPVRQCRCLVQKAVYSRKERNVMTLHEVINDSSSSDIVQGRLGRILWQDMVEVECGVLLGSTV